MTESNQIMTKRRHERFLSEFEHSNIVFLVGLDKQKVHGIFEVVSTASSQLAKLCKMANSNRQVLVTDESDTLAFCMLMNLLHPHEGVTVRIDDVTVVRRVLPLLKTYELKARLEECEEFLLKQDRSPIDMVHAKEYALP